MRDFSKKAFVCQHYFVILPVEVNAKIRRIMKRQFRVFAVVAALVVSVPAFSQLHFGLKAGLNVTKVSLDKATVTDTDNRCGWFAGPMVEFTLPVVGLGMDAAVLYDNKSIGIETESGEKHENLSYIDIPLNFKYSIGIGNIAGVFVTTGPQFSFNVGDDKIFSDLSVTNVQGSVTDLGRKFELKKSEFSWNVGAGVKLLKHLQMAYNYNIAIGKTADMSVDLSTVTGVAGSAVQGKLKNNTHQISVAYLF